MPTGSDSRSCTSCVAGSGGGVVISAADLDLRGAGDLIGERQAGHVRAVGTELYRRLLLDAVARERGDARGLRRPSCTWS